MNTEKIIEIRTEEDAAKWVGRKVRMGWRCHRTGRTTNRSGGTGAVHHYNSDGGTLRVYLDNDRWLPHTNNDPITIELLDGAAHPRPEGDGWVWCETNEQALAFADRNCELSAGGSLRFDPKTLRGKLRAMVGGVVVHEGSETGGLRITTRRGAWIRLIPETPAPAVKTPEREAAEGLELRAVTLDDRASEASAAAAACHAELRVARKLANASEERAEEDARYPLPGDWRWGPSKRGGGFAAFDVSYECCVQFGGEIELYDHEDEDANWAHAPFAVIQAVHNRNIAERAK